MLKSIVIDDEPMALEVIKSFAKKINFLKVQHYFTDAFEALDFLQKNEVDLLFLDISMPDISGIDLLKSISNPPLVIFTTAYSEHAVQSFELDAIDYLLKPFSLARFIKSCNKANEQFELRNKSFSKKDPSIIFIKSGYDLVRVDLKELLYVEGTGNYVKLVLTDRNILTRLTMKEALELLPTNDFIRVHRSYIIAKKRIFKYNKTDVWINKTQIPIGDAYRENLENSTL